MNREENTGTLSAETLMMIAAQTCHEVNRAYCESLGDRSQKPWDQAPDWQRESALEGVNYHMKHPGATPAAAHENWMRHKKADGWKYGTRKNVKEKEHPCLIEYEYLPVQQRTKDALFSAVCSSLLGC